MKPEKQPRKVPSRVRIGTFEVDDLTLDETITELNAHLMKPEGSFLVVTPNLTNVAVFHSDVRVRRAYQQANLVLADGWPIKLAARWRNRQSVSLVPGSALLPLWVGQLRQPTRFLVIGGKNGLAISQALYQLSSYVEVAKFEDSQWLDDTASAKRLIHEISKTSPDVVLLLLGSPKQEVLALNAIESGFCGVILCLGAAGDFIAHMPKRAPQGVQRAGLEWLYRITQEPARLGPRYLKAVRPFWQAIKK